MNPKLSIVIPVYNAGTYIDQCLGSLLKQHFKDWELILVNDGSTDNSLEICNNYAQKDKRIVVIDKKNEGVSTARNIGMDNAKGRYVAFVDADDYMGEDFLSPMEEENNEDVVFTQYLCFDDNSISEGENIAPTNTIDDRKALNDYLSTWLHQNIMRTPWGKFIKRDVINDARFPVGQRIGEDSVFMFKVLSHVKSLKTATNSTYMWRTHSDNFAEKYQLKVEDAIRYLFNIYNAYRSIGVSSPHLEATLYFTFFMLAEKDMGPFRWKWFARPSIIKLWKSIDFDYKYIHKDKFKKYRIFKPYYQITDSKELYVNIPKNFHQHE